MIEHEIERQQPPPGDFQRGRPAVTDGGDLQLPVDLLAEDPADPAAVGDGLRRYRLVGNACPEQRLDKAVGAGLGVSEESLDLVPGEQARVQADQSDPLGLLPGEAKRPQQFFPSLQMGNQGSLGLGHGVSMPEASRSLNGFSVSKREVVLVLFRAWELVLRSLNKLTYYAS